MLAYLINVISEEGALHIVYVTMSRCLWQLHERLLLSLNVLGGLEVVDPTQRNNSVYRLLIFQINVLVLVNSPTTSTVHHNLLFFINGETPFSSWQVVFSWYGVEVNSRDLDEYIISSNIKLQSLQVIVHIVNQDVNALIASAPYIKVFISKMQPQIPFMKECIEELSDSC